MLGLNKPGDGVCRENLLELGLRKFREGLFFDGNLRGAAVDRRVPTGEWPCARSTLMGSPGGTEPMAVRGLMVGPAPISPQ